MFSIFERKLIIACVILVLTRIFIVSHYHIASDAMAPAIPKDSFIFINKIVFGIPFNNEKVLATSRPKTNDAILVDHKGTEYVRLVAATYYDEIKVNPFGFLVINGITTKIHTTSHEVKLTPHELIVCDASNISWVIHENDVIGRYITHI